MSEYHSMSNIVDMFAGMRRAREEGGSLIRRRAAEHAAKANAEIRRENEWLRMLIRALVALCLEKGLITEQELKDRIAKLDADDEARAKERRAAARARRAPRR